METKQYNQQINSDQLTREIRTLFAQINVEFDTQLELLSIETVGDVVTIAFNNPLPGDGTQLDELMANHVPEEPVAETLSEYDGNVAAKEGGLLVGDFYRTGEFVKIVF